MPLEPSVTSSSIEDNETSAHDEHVGFFFDIRDFLSWWYMIGVDIAIYEHPTILNMFTSLEFFPKSEMLKF